MVLTLTALVFSTAAAEEFKIESELFALPGLIQGEGSPEAICGPQDDSQDIEYYDGRYRSVGISDDYAIKYGKSTFLLKWKTADQIREELHNVDPGTIGGRRWCSATLIDDDVAITAGHCFSKFGEGKSNGLGGAETSEVTKTPRYISPEVWVPPASLAKLQVAIFDFHIDSEAKRVAKTSEFPVVKLIEYGLSQDSRLDYAIIRLGTNQDGRTPAEALGRDYIASLETSQPESQDVIAIIQHPHGALKRIDAGRIRKVSGFRLEYNDVDTLNGSSGAAIRDVNGRVIGIHTRGGCDLMRLMRSNAGVSLTSIMAVSVVIN